MKRILIWGGIGLAVAALVVYSAWPRPRAVETAACTTGDIRAFVSEEAETRLDQEYVVAMPVTGRLLRIDLKEGDDVDSGAVIARIDTFERRARLKTLESQVSEKRAMILGVDRAKPKPEDIRAAELAVEEAALREDAAKKAYDIARINFDQEEKQHDRIRQLFEAGTVSQSEFDESQRKYLTLKSARDEAQLQASVAATAITQARVKLKRLRESVDDNEYQRAAYEAQIQQLEAEMAILRDELAKSEIRAPVTGPVLRKLRIDEQVLTAGTALLTIGDLTSIRIESDILSEDVGQVREKQPVEITGLAISHQPPVTSRQVDTRHAALEARGSRLEALTGTVERIFPAGFEKISSLGIEQQRVKVIVKFDNSKVNLRPGVRVDIKIITAEKHGVLLVPERALFRTRDQWHVFVVRDGRAHLTPVDVGLRNDEVAEITRGLAKDDVVVLSPDSDLDDGARVAANAVE